MGGSVELADIVGRSLKVFHGSGTEVKPEFMAEKNPTRYTLKIDRNISIASWADN